MAPVDPAFVRRDRIALSCKGSHVILHAAEKKAHALGVPECIAVVDASGELLAFSRMDDARPGSIDDVRRVMENFSGLPQELKLRTAPAHLLPQQKSNFTN